MGKKVSIFLLVILLIFSLAACENSGCSDGLQNTQQISSQSKIQGTDTSKTTAPTEPTGAVASTQTETTGDINSTQTAQTIESTQVTETIEQAQTAETTDAIASTEPIETTEISENTETEATVESGKTLVVYFSWSTAGNTQKMAEYIKKQTGGDVLRLEPANPYPTEYSETGDVAKVERDENARPEIANLPASISQYSTIFLGYPIWWHTAPMIIGTFLESYDLTGVEIYPFTQSASMDVEQFNNSMNFVRENAPEANVHDGLFAEASDTEKIMEYLTDNGFVE